MTDLSGTGFAGGGGFSLCEIEALMNAKWEIDMDGEEAFHIYRGLFPRLLSEFGHLCYPNSSIRDTHSLEQSLSSAALRDVDLSDMIPHFCITLCRYGFDF